MIAKTYLVRVYLHSVERLDGMLGEDPPGLIPNIMRTPGGGISVFPYHV